MMNTLLLASIILFIAAVMTMTGRGGGNFYVLAIALSGFGMHTAATTGQFILVISSLTAAIMFGRQKVTDWKLVFLMGSMTMVSAFLGGLLSDTFPDKGLKTLFALFVAVASLLMLKPVKKEMHKTRRLTLILDSGEDKYHVFLPLVIPVVLGTGFISGMVGISGGSFLVPLMILAIGVPMHKAVGTSTTLVMITASAGFLGHLSSGHFDYRLALPLAVGGLVGGAIGAKLTAIVKPKKLKVLFALTSLTAAAIMMINTF